MEPVIEIGNPVILRDAKGLKKHGLHKGMQGWANSLVHVEDVEYIMFQPDKVDRFYWIERNRCILDEEKLKGMEE